MIKVIDHCEDGAFLPEELEGLICYIRLFLESIFTQTHDNVFIHVHVKEKSDSLYPETSGFITHDKFGHFTIVVFKDTRRKMVRAISHELVHIKQFLEDGFKIDRKNNKIYWEGQFYLALSEVIRMQRERSFEVYNMLPWEHEAGLIIQAVASMVSEKLHSVYKSDPKLEKYLQMCLSETKYNCSIDKS